MAPAPRIARIAAFVAVTVVGVALLLEAALHVYNPLRSTVRFNQVILNRNNRVEIHNRATSKLAPVVVSSTNSLGFRGPEPPARFAQALTIVAVGGSTTEGLHVADDATWPARLETELRPEFPSVWVNNAGLSGHSTLGHVVLVRDYVSRLRPRVVVFLVGLNDVRRPDDGEAGERSYDFVANSSRPGWRHALNDMLLRSELVSAVVTLKRHVHATRLELPDSPRYDLRTVAHVRDADTDRDRRLATTRERLIPGYLRRLETLIELCEAHGILPIFLTQPVLYGAGVDPVTGVDLETIRVRDGSGKQAWLTLEVFNTALEDLGARRGVLVVDLANRLPKSSDLYYDLIHYTDAGGRAVARIVADAIRGPLATRFPELRTRESEGRRSGRPSPGSAS